MDDAETNNRRARLRELIRECFNDTLADLIRHIAQRTGKAPNQGELSAIQKANSGKSFGDKKAKTLTEQIGLSRRWFDMPIGKNIKQTEWLLSESIEGSGKNVVEDVKSHGSGKVRKLPPPVNKEIAKVIRLMESTDDTGRAIALNSVEVALDKYRQSSAPRKQAK